MIPASAWAEALVAPCRAGEAAIRTAREFSEQLPVVVAEIDADTALAASRLRARHGQKLKLPDALVVATAMQMSADVLVTTDRDWPTKRRLGYRGELITI